MAGVAPRCRGEGIGLAFLGSCPDEKVRRRRTIRVVPRVVSRPCRGGIFLLGFGGGCEWASPRFLAEPRNDRGYGVVWRRVTTRGCHYGATPRSTLREPQGERPLPGMNPGSGAGMTEGVGWRLGEERAIKRVAPTEEGMDSCLRRNDGGGRNGFPCRGTRMTVKDRQQTCRANG